jgi:hypothetical protein
MQCDYCVGGGNPAGLTGLTTYLSRLSGEYPSFHVFTMAWLHEDVQNDGQMDVLRDLLASSLALPLPMISSTIAIHPSYPQT